MTSDSTPAPSEWVLVPKLPDETMLRAANKASLSTAVLMDDARFACERASYIAAVEAAPPPPGDDEAAFEAMARARYEASHEGYGPTALNRWATWDEACQMAGWREREIANMQAAVLAGRSTPPPTVADMAAFAASEEACIRYPGEDERPLRPAFMDAAAASAARSRTPSGAEEGLVKLIAEWAERCNDPPSRRQADILKRQGTILITRLSDALERLSSPPERVGGVTREEVAIVKAASALLGQYDSNLFANSGAWEALRRALAQRRPEGS